jgi:plastocyanin
MEDAVQLRPIIASLVPLAAVAGVIAGCGGSDVKPSAAQAGEPVAHATASGNQLGISGFKFRPGSLTVDPGGRITITNRDGTAHTVTADNGRSFDTGNIDPGAAATVTLSKAGTYAFHCTIHPFMHGTFVVR